MGATVVVRVPGELQARLRALQKRETRGSADVVRAALLRGVESLEKDPHPWPAIGVG
jgi:predicted DNA-binding protein